MKSESQLRPSGAIRADIEPQQSCLEAFQEICRTTTTQILQNWAVVRVSDDREGPHQMRVGVRRFRAALRLFRPVATGPDLRKLDRRARDLARCVGVLRDADVLATDIVGGVGRDYPRAVGMRALQSVLSSDCDEKRQKVRDQLAKRSSLSLQRDLASIPDNLQHLIRAEDAKQLSRPIGSVSDELLRRRWRKVASYGKRIDKLEDAERHEMRKALKTFRYSVEMLAPLYPRKRIRRFLDDMSELQDILGNLNDVATAERMLQGRLTEATDPSLAHAAGFVIGWHSARAELAWTEARSAWKRLENVPRLW